eukprot:747262_1
MANHPTPSEETELKQDRCRDLRIHIEEAKETGEFQILRGTSSITLYTKYCPKLSESNPVSINEALSALRIPVTKVEGEESNFSTIVSDDLNASDPVHIRPIGVMFL